jgi:uncharacterized protein YggT (Ycf19 family)
MGFIDFILNLVGLLLLLNWRSRRFDPLQQTRPVTLVGTLKRTDSRHIKGWQLAGLLACLLGGRAIFYWFIGAPVDWAPKLALGIIALAFRSDVFHLALLYSILSFGRLLFVFYFWLLCLAAINRRVIEPDPIHKLLRLHLGRAAHWAWPVQLLLLPILAVGVWLILNPLLAHLGVLSRVHSIARLVSQGLLVSLGLLISLKYLLSAVLLVHLVSSYVFFGSGPFWEFISMTARNLLTPLRPIPLRLARLDFAPVAAMVLILLTLEWLPTYIVGKLTEWKVSFWPQ